jgi:dihydrofolate synthase / folylpolyglutamate synthase
MTYSEATAFLYDRLPAYERGDGVKAIKPGLTNIRALAHALGDPHTRFPSIHVGGTNGKGSTSHMLAAVYQAAGYRVGLYTSPHLTSFTERIRLNGEPISETAVAAFVGTHQGLIEAIGPSFFEVTVAMAFDYFSQNQVDLAIVEVGLGGRLDSTNIITPVLSIITNIGLDHQEVLGHTLDRIAEEKAGIIKPGVPVVISEYQEEVQSIFLQKSIINESKLYNVNDILSINNNVNELNVNLIDGESPLFCSLLAINPFTLDLSGAYQQKNVGAVLTTVAVLADQFPVSAMAVRAGLANVTRSTGLRGRWQVLDQQPLVVADTAHNLPGIEAALVTGRRFNPYRLHMVVGLVADKDTNPLLAVLPTDAVYYFCDFTSLRAMPAADLQQRAAVYGLSGKVFTSVNAGLRAARMVAGVNDLILITGSTYLVAEVDGL